MASERYIQRRNFYVQNFKKHASALMSLYNFIVSHLRKYNIELGSHVSYTFANALVNASDASEIVFNCNVSSSRRYYDPALQVRKRCCRLLSIIRAVSLLYPNILSCDNMRHVYISIESCNIRRRHL